MESNIFIHNFKKFSLTFKFLLNESINQFDDLIIDLIDFILENFENTLKITISHFKNILIISEKATLPSLYDLTVFLPHRHCPISSRTNIISPMEGTDGRGATSIFSARFISIRAVQVIQIQEGSRKQRNFVKFEIPNY